MEKMKLNVEDYVLKTQLMILKRESRTFDFSDAGPFLLHTLDDHGIMS